MITAWTLLLAAAPALAPAAPDTAFLTYESGALVAVDWIQRRGRQMRSRSVLMQSAVREATIELRSGGAAAGSSTIAWNAGDDPGKPTERTLGEGWIFWSDQIAGSVEWAVQRASALGATTSTIPAASLYRDSRTDVRVQRIDSTDWTVDCNRKHYEVLTDSEGRVLSAILPEYGVVIERRVGFTPASYPLWPTHAAAPGAAYRAEEVRIPAPGGHVLAGTLTVPSGSGPFPGAVLITGLGPSNRNGGVPPWMPLRDLADALSRSGVVVLRVDDRGVGESSGDHASSTTFDEADDVRTEVRWLRAHRGVDRRRIALVGYSEGGLIAPMVAADDPTIAGIITLAGPGVSGPEVARYQTEAEVVRDTSIAIAARNAEIAKRLAEPLTPRERSYLGIDPFAFARRVRCPALILQGGSDLQVPVRSAERLANAMREGGNRDVSVRVFPNVSHSFLPDPVGLNSGWAALPGFMTSPDVLREITAWAATRGLSRDGRRPR